MNIQDLHKQFLSTTGVCTDTRKITNDCLYVALKGGNFDGNNFVNQALESGAKLALTDDERNVEKPNCIYVKDCLQSLQELAHYHRKQLSIPVIGITGTNGKTTTKELLVAVLSEKFKVSATAGNFNNHIGVPLTLLAIKDTAEIAVVEMGANHVGEIAELCEIVEPEYGVLTNVGKAHLDGFGSYENIIKTKVALYESVQKQNGIVFVNGNDQLLVDKSKENNRKLYSTSQSDFVYSPIIEGFTVGVKVESTQINSNLFGEYNTTNIAVACQVGLYFGMSLEEVKRGIENYTPSNNRSQTVKTETNTLLLDAYNANPSSMEVAISNYAKLNFDSKCLILGEMFELGNVHEAEHQKVINLCEQLSFDHVVYIGNWPTNNNCYNSVADYVAELAQNPIKNSHVLIKGSRGIQLEKLVEFL